MSPRNPPDSGLGTTSIADDVIRGISDESTDMHGVRARTADRVAAGRHWQLSEQRPSHRPNFFFN